MEAVMERHPFAQSDDEERAVNKLMADLERSIAALRKSPNYLGDCPWCDGPVNEGCNSMQRDGGWWHRYCSRRSGKFGGRHWRISDGIGDIRVRQLSDGSTKITDTACREACVIIGSDALPMVRDAIFAACSEAKSAEEDDE